MDESRKTGQPEAEPATPEDQDEPAKRLPGRYRKRWSKLVLFMVLAHLVGLASSVEA
ncbi:hypothetical protein [Halomonas sp. BC04]|uniref:hypothetical protein n=1 Tax=Halomonas sp. BC04 TaxID=1403540 RepID=UPI0003ED699C|nr:hypothetical protein Q427_30145 [Halomonas sp. BC04]